MAFLVGLAVQRLLARSSAGAMMLVGLMLLIFLIAPIGWVGLVEMCCTGRLLTCAIDGFIFEVASYVGTRGHFAMQAIIPNWVRPVPTRDFLLR